MALKLDKPWRSLTGVRKLISGELCIFNFTLVILA